MNCRKPSAALVAAALLVLYIGPATLYADGTEAPPATVSTLGSPVRAATLNAATMQHQLAAGGGSLLLGGTEVAGVQVAADDLTMSGSVSTMGSMLTAAELNAATWMTATSGGTALPPYQGQGTRAEAAGVQTEGGGEPQSVGTLGDPAKAEALNAATTATSVEPEE